MGGLYKNKANAVSYGALRPALSGTEWSLCFASQIEPLPKILYA
jgi:hypothetical protein